MVRKSGLGKGLGALIPEGEEPEVVESELTGPLRTVTIESIRPNRFQPRTVFSPESLHSLAASIKEMGVLQPLIVRPLPDESGLYELIAGERRLRAATLAGLTAVPALIQDDVNDRLSLEQAVVENLHRVDLHPLEEAAAYQQLIDDFNLTHEQVAIRVGKSRTAVTNTLRLLNLSEKAQSALASGDISAGHARALLAIADAALQASMVDRIVGEDLSVRGTEDAVRKMLAPLAAVPVPEVAPSSIDETPAPPRLRPVPDASVAELEHLLEDYLSTRVHVDLKGRNGKIVIDFADLDDLERIYLAISTVR